MRKVIVYHSDMRYPHLLIASLLALAVACSSPVAPRPTPTTLALAGQSNAILLRPSLSALAPVIGAGDQGATAISCWASTGPCWLALKPTLAAQPLKAFIWWQGEMDILTCVVPDTYGPCDRQYGVALANLFSRVRLAAGNPNLPIVVMQMGAWAAHWRPQTTVESDTLGWVAQDRHALYIDTRDLEYRTDGIHMTEAGYTAVAQRIVAMIR